VINDAIALVAGAPHAAAARAYIEWAGSREAQEIAAREAYKLPARTDLEPQALPEWTRPVLAVLHAADYDRALAARETPAWMSEWDRTVRGSAAR
jgi:iron(III) transport system substrate-binding protein